MLTSHHWHKGLPCCTAKQTWHKISLDAASRDWHKNLPLCSKTKIPIYVIVCMTLSFVVCLGMLQLNARAWANRHRKVLSFESLVWAITALFFRGHFQSLITLT